MHSSLAILLQLLGAATLVSSFTRLYLFIRAYSCSTNVIKYSRGSNTWALVTGGSDGIGLGIADQLMAHGFNTILLGHKAEELALRAKQLGERFPELKVRVLAVNAATASIDELESALSSVSHCRITILVNNVGGLTIQTGQFRAFSEYSATEADDTVYLNARFMVRITRSLLPTLIRNGPSLVLNIGSGSDIGIPYQVLYSASKGFVSTFSAALRRELEAEAAPVDVTLAIPGNVQSGSHKATLSWDTPSAQHYSQCLVAKLGNGITTTTGFWPHAMQLWSLSCMPDAMSSGILKKMMLAKKTAHD